MPGTVLGAGGTAVNKWTKSLSSLFTLYSGKQTDKYVRNNTPGSKKLYKEKERRVKEKIEF